MRSSLFSDVMQRGLIVTDVSGQHRFGLQGSPETPVLSITLGNIPEQRSHDDTILRQHDTAFTEEVGLMVMLLT